MTNHPLNHSKLMTVRFGDNKMCMRAAVVPAILGVLSGNEETQ